MQNLSSATNSSGLSPTPADASRDDAPPVTASPPARPLTIAEEIDALTDPSFMTSLARGLAVVKAFSDQRRARTLPQFSKKTGIPRAAVGACLSTPNSRATPMQRQTTFT